MKINFEEDKNRSIAYVGEKEIGKCTFSKSKDIWIIDHTYVDREYKGQGIGKKLVDKVVENARNRGIRLMATCPFALKLFETSEEYADVYKK